MNKFEMAVMIAANSVEQLRKCDVFRVLNENRQVDGLADWLKAKRPELAQEVDESEAELKGEQA